MIKIFLNNREVISFEGKTKIDMNSNIEILGTSYRIDSIEVEGKLMKVYCENKPTEIGFSRINANPFHVR